MKHLARILVTLAWVGWVPLAIAQKEVRYPLPAKVMQAKSALIVCECPRDLAVAEPRARLELQRWGRFQVVERRNEADLVFVFSGNKYLGDYLTRDGPDKRPMSVDFTILTIVDPTTGENLWTDSRRWGSWRVDHATKDLIAELKEQIEDQTKKWTLNDILMCSVAPQFTELARLTPDDAMKKSKIGGNSVAGTPDHLILSSPNAPNFCKQAQLLIGAENRIVGFEVLATQADRLDVNEVIQQADQFEFSGGKNPNSDQVYFNAQSKDKKVFIQFEVEGHKSVLSRVRYFFSHEGSAGQP